LWSLAGLSVGDAFGELFFDPSNDPASRKVPDGIWKWTDDTHMALSVTEVLMSKEHIDEDELAQLFAQRYTQEPWRGYAAGARKLLTLYAEGADWKTEAPRIFGSGSYGNGGAMRAAPIGAYFAGDPERAGEEAKRSAQVTHAHIEGQAGAIAVAAAAAIAASTERQTGADFIRQVLPLVPATKTKEKIEEAISITSSDCDYAARTLGTGQFVAAFDTVPFCLWVTAHHSHDYETALWTTVDGGGDVDTTCAIVGGIVALFTQIPREWLRHREPLPEGFAV
jgi:ADP-ribosylglycohydrolase